MDQIVSVLLQARGAGQFAGQMAQMARSASVTQQAVMRMNSTVSAVQATVLAAAGGLTVASIARIGSEFENTKSKIAGFLSALGETRNFESGLTAADTLLKSIELKSAALPGDAEDYIRVFTQGLPTVQKAMKGSLDQMVDFTNTYSAVGSSFGIDSQQMAMDLTRMLQVGRGGAGLDVRTYTTLLPFMQQVKGQANLTAESFNKMANTDRMKLLQKTLAQLEPMVQRQAKSWDAISGTSKTVLRTLVRTATAGMFDRMKSSLTRLNALFMDQNGHLTALSMRLVAYAERAGSAIGVVMDKTITWLERTVGSADQLPKVFDRIEESIKRVAIAYASLKTVDFAGDLTRAGIKISAEQASIRAKAAKEAADKLPAVAAFRRGGELGSSADTAAQWGARLSAGAGAETGAAASGGGIAAAAASAPAWLAVGAAMVAAGTAAYTMSEHWQTIGPVVEKVLGYFTSVVFPQLIEAGKNLWVVLGPLVDLVGSAVLLTLNGAILGLGLVLSGLATVVNTVADAIRWAARKLGLLGDDLKKTPAPKTNVQMFNMMQGLRRGTPLGPYKYEGRSLQYGEDDFKRRMNVSTPMARGGNKIHQDFRNSKFTIDQKFEEGFDPDRIAFAFANDLRKVGEFRLQSGLEPLFSLGG